MYCTRERKKYKNKPVTLWPCIISLVMLCNEHIMSSRGDVVSISRAFQTDRDAAAVNYLPTPRLWYASVNTGVWSTGFMVLCTPPLFLSKSHTEEAGMEGAVPSFLMTSLSTSPMTISRFSSVLSVFPLLPTLQIQNKRAISSITKSKQKIQTKMALLYGKLLTIMCSTCAVC